MTVCYVGVLTDDVYTMLGLDKMDFRHFYNIKLWATEYRATVYRKHIANILTRRLGVKMDSQCSLLAFYAIRMDM